MYILNIFNVLYNKIENFNILLNCLTLILRNILKL